MAMIGGLLELFIIAMAAAAIAYYSVLGVVVGLGLAVRRIVYGKDKW